jgi:hypothetical protein
VFAHRRLGRKPTTQQLRCGFSQRANDERRVHRLRLRRLVDAVPARPELRHDDAARARERRENLRVVASVVPREATRVGAEFRGASV